MEKKVIQENITKDVRNPGYRKNFCKRLSLGILLAGMLALSLTGCQKAGKAPDSSQAESLNKKTAESDSAGSRKGETKIPNTEESTEKATESLYNKDGTRRAWVKAEGRVNVRKKADKKAEFLGSFPDRQEIRLLNEKKVKGFYVVSGKDYTTGETIQGYASAAYITLDAPEDPRVELDIPLYLQTDERWGKVLLGSTKKTMYDIGCATTSLAMSETYLKKKEIYPDELAADAIYTADGEIGWPRDYYWNYSKDMYLDFVYNKLHEGIPVLIGCARTNGRPHWVLITGYTGDGTVLKAKDFKINDPLPYKRTNLQQYLDEYPVFNKLIYYCKDRKLIVGSDEYKAAQKAKKKKNAGKAPESKKESAAKKTQESKE